MGRSATLFSKLTCSKKPSESTGQRADRQTISNGALWSFTRAASQSSYRIRAGFFGFRSRVSNVDMCAAKGHAALLPKADMCGATTDVPPGPIATWLHAARAFGRAHKPQQLLLFLLILRLV